MSRRGDRRSGGTRAKEGGRGVGMAVGGAKFRSLLRWASAANSVRYLLRSRPQGPCSIRSGARVVFLNFPLARLFRSPSLSLVGRQRGVFLPGGIFNAPRQLLTFVPFQV